MTIEQTRPSRYPVVDADSHVIEPPDLWASRMPRKWGELTPAVVADEASVPRWRIGTRWLNPVAHYATAGWREYPPSAPPTLDDADPAAWQPEHRLAKMDQYGITAQVLYPNLLGFDSETFLGEGGSDFAIDCVRAYNDYLVEEYGNTDSRRFIPIMMLPFWDTDLAITELERCIELGHRGVLFANRFERAGLPPCDSKHWYPIYARAAEAGLSINFHIGFQEKQGSAEAESAQRAELVAARQQLGEDDSNAQARLVYVRFTIPLFLSNADTLTRLLTSDLCIDFPDLKFVSVESGFGYVPYLLEAIDWQWSNLGARDLFGSRPLPSELFKRQCYGTFWFEEKTLSLLNEYPSNFMFSTDFPHPTSVSPGPASYAAPPNIHIDRAFDRLDDDIAANALGRNAVAVYGLDLP